MNEVTQATREAIHEINDVLFAHALRELDELQRENEALKLAIEETHKGEPWWIALARKTR